MANSWKKYGGMYKSDKYNTIGVGTLVADQVFIRQRVINSAQIGGSLIVGENVSIGNDLKVDNNTTISGELYAATDTYIGNKIFFNHEQDISNNYVAFLSGNSKTGGIGVGTTTPTSFFDINITNSLLNSGDGSTSGDSITDVLSIRNSNNYIRNVIAQNIHKSGVVVDTSGNIASIGFYNGNVDNNTATSVTNITSDTSNGSINIFAIDNFINSTNNNQINSNNNTIIESNNNIEIITRVDSIINTDNDLIITTGNISKINSIVTVSNREINDQVLNGTITIYDNSASVFLYDYYEDTSIKSGNAISLVSNDASSNASLNIITPNNNGLSIIGGAFPQDTTRSMGTIGIIQSDISYIPSQVFVSNINQEKYRTSIGVNTYAPESSKYVMDINGPTRIGNGEIHIRYFANFQQVSTHFSKQTPSFGVVVGKPYISEITSDGQTRYSYSMLTTTDGGANWTNNMLDNELFAGSLTYDIFSAYTINRNEVFLLSSISKVGYINLDTQEIIAGEYNYPEYKFNTFYVSQNDNYKILIGGERTLNENTSQVYYYYNFTDISFSNTPNFIDASCSVINHCDGSNNIIYVAGNGIEKIDFNSDTPISISYTQIGFVYNKIFAYNEKYVVATGLFGEDSIISYTYDGGINWYNADTTDFNKNYDYQGFNSSSPYHSFSIKALVLINSYDGIAVGTITDDNGERILIIYTNDQSKTWKIVHPKILYSSGVGYLLTKTTINSFYPTSNSGFVISDNIVDGTNIGEFNSGKSNIIYGFFPNIFNTYENQVIDVNGGMNVDGKIIQF